MAKKPTNENKSLAKNLTEPNRKIIATWPVHEQKAIEANCQKKLRDFTGKDINALEEELIFIQKDIGIRQLLTDPEIERLIEKILAEFQDFSIKEISHAVHEAMMGRLLGENGIPIDPKHYGEFGFMYLAAILKPYQFQRGRLLRRYHDAEIQIVKEQATGEKRPLTEAEQRESKIKWALAAFKSYKNQNPTIGLYTVYEFLVSEQIINFTPERMRVCEERAKEQLKVQARKGSSAAQSVLDILKSDPMKSESDMSFLHTVHTIACKAFFEDLISTETDLGDFFPPGSVDK